MKCSMNLLMSLVKIIQYLCKQSKKRKCFFFFDMNIELNGGDIIKNYIEYYYKFRNINITKKGNEYYFDYYSNYYIFTPQLRNINELEEITKLMPYYDGKNQIIRKKTIINNMERKLWVNICLSAIYC